MSKWNYRNVVPGHYRRQKDGREIKNPGYDILEKPLYSWMKSEKPNFNWFRPSKPKPIKRRDKRGQSKPR